MVPIPYARSYTVLTEGSVVKTVQCEHCGGEYLYQMTRQMEGEGLSLLFLDNAGAKKRAKEESHTLLLQELETSCDPVPCPLCGWYQQNMVALLRQLRWRWLKTVAWLVLLAAAACLFVMFAVMTKYDASEGGDLLNTWMTRTGVLVGASLALFLVRSVGARLYNPNAADERQRRELGQTLSLSKADFLKMKEAEQSDDR